MSNFNGRGYKPIIRTTSIQTFTDEVDLAAVYADTAIPEKFILELDQSVPDTNLDTYYVQNSGTPVPLVKPDGTQIYASTLKLAMILRFYGRLPNPLNVNQFKAAYRTHPNRIVICDCLPCQRVITSLSAPTTQTSTPAETSTGDTAEDGSIGEAMPINLNSEPISTSSSWFSRSSKKSKVEDTTPALI